MGEPLSAAVYTGLLLLMNADYIFAAVGLTLTIVLLFFSQSRESKKYRETSGSIRLNVKRRGADVSRRPLS